MGAPPWLISYRDFSRLFRAKQSRDRIAAMAAHAHFMESALVAVRSSLFLQRVVC
jgi:hypothetical protein